MISHRVPSGSPGRRTETLASQRNDPSCMLPSQMPIQRTSECSAFAYATASFDPRMSGSVTISSSGVPARLRSMPDMPLLSAPCEPFAASCRDFPASSSRCARRMRIVFSPDSVAILSVPCCTTGSSYWLIW